MDYYLLIPLLLSIVLIIILAIVLKKKNNKLEEITSKFNFIKTMKFIFYYHKWKMMIMRFQMK